MEEAVDSSSTRNTNCSETASYFDSKTTSLGANPGFPAKYFWGISVIDSTEKILKLDFSVKRWKWGDLVHSPGGVRILSPSQPETILEFFLEPFTY